MNKGQDTKDWYIFRNPNTKKEIKDLPPPPPWREFQKGDRRKYYEFQLDDEVVAAVNAALYLRRPLLVSGPPGTGKSSLAYAIAKELELGEVLRWSITSRSTLAEAQYRYDAIGRLQAQRLTLPKEGEHSSPIVPIGRFLQLGPLGTAFADSKEKPRVLLIDEFDKSDIDLPNDLLNIFEEGHFEIPELSRLVEDEQQKSVTIRQHNSSETVEIEKGHVTCTHFPIIIITSNGERELPAPFLRRCLHIKLAPPDAKRLKDVVNAHFLKQINELPQEASVQRYIEQLAKELETRNTQLNEYVATDQLLNAIYLRLKNADGFTAETANEIVQRDRTAPERQLLELVLQAISRTSQL